MKNSVIIKGVQSGIVVKLDKNLEYEKLKRDIEEKFKSSAKFLGDANVAINFEGRDLTDAQIEDVLQIIKENTSLNVVCVLLKDKKKEEFYKKCVEKSMQDIIAYEEQQKRDIEKRINEEQYLKESLAMEQLLNSKDPSEVGIIQKGGLRSGQALESDTSVIIIGDVNYGANIVSKGNVIVLGTLFGNVHAGSGGTKEAFVIALEMQATQIRIGNIIARSSDSHTIVRDKDTKIAYVEDGRIYIEKLNKSVIKDLKM